jgi:hypothetical protein
MIRPTMERLGKGPKNMREATANLKRVSEVLDLGVEGCTVVTGIEAASLAWRIRKDQLQSMAKNNQELNLRVVHDTVIVELKGAVGSRRSVYIYMYSLLQADLQGQGREFAERVKSPAALEEIPVFQSAVEQVKVGRSMLSEEDQSDLSALLWNYYESLRNKSGLQDPSLVLTSVGY